MKRQKYAFVLSRNAATVDGKTVIKKKLLTLHFTPSIIHKEFLKEHFLFKSPTKLSDNKGSVSSKEVHQQDECSFERGVGEGKGHPKYVEVGL